jgi:predicted enzyme related to lactoylglutathione lyase
MSDPFEALRTPVVPIDPDPEFSAQLRARIERALSLPKGVHVSDVTLEPQPGRTDPIRQGDVGYVSLWVPEIERAAAFYSSVLGWTYEPSSGPQNRRVTSLSLDHGLSGGHEHATLFLCFAVDDLDQALERVRAAGGQEEAPTEEPYGRIAMCVDNEGSSFALYQPPDGPRESRPAPNGTRHGDLSYITMEVHNSAEAMNFYSSVLGWRFVPGRVEDGWTPPDVTPMTGMHGGHDLPMVVPMYRVDDIHSAVERVRAGGGRATDPEQQPYGLSSECADDQGTHFYLGQH